MHKLSICIPTFNRQHHLVNCLNAIILNKNYRKEDVQICVSDNCSTDETESVVRDAQKKIDIVYQKNDYNVLSANIVEVVDMADGEYVWIIGDDDMLLPSALEEVVNLIDKNRDVDFFYINNFDLTAEYVLERPQPFDTNNLPEWAKKESLVEYDGKMDFFDLLNPKISKYFMSGIMVSVFKRKKWVDSVNVLDFDALYVKTACSNFDNTYPHAKIFAKAFAESKAYFYSTPLCIALSGDRGWESMTPYIRSVRLVELVEEYRKNGLPYIRYIKCKNVALRTFIPDIVYMFLHKKSSGYEYINPLKLLFKNCLYPEFYLSLFLFPFRYPVIKYIVRRVKTGKFYPQ